MTFGFGTRTVYDNVFTVVDSISGANRISFDVTKPNGVITLGVSGNLISNNIVVGTGSPEGVVSGPVGAIYQRQDGSTGTTLYTKESGSGNTGWSVVGGSSGISGGVAGQIAIWSSTSSLSASSSLSENLNSISTTKDISAQRVIVNSSQGLVDIKGRSISHIAADGSQRQLAGHNWVSRASAGDFSWRSICWSPELKTFCSVSYTGSSNRVMTSNPDGSMQAPTFIIPHGSAPSSPVNGQIWTTTAGLYVRINGSTVGPIT